MDKYILLFILLLNFTSCSNGNDKQVNIFSAPTNADSDRQIERDAMVDITIVDRGIKNPEVIKAMRRVKRHEFVPARLQYLAYIDDPLPIGEDQTISQPYIVAIMAELADATGEEKVLEIGTGSGYGAAVLSELAKEVYTIEIIPKLGEIAKERLEKLGYTNVHVRVGDGYFGWPEQAPFDAIVITAAPPKVPQPLLDQLAEGGKLVAPVGKYYQELEVYTKSNGKISVKKSIPVIFVPMTGEAQKN